MIPWLTDLLWDRKTFGNVIRAGVFLIGELTTSLVPSAKGYWLGKMCQAAALLIRSPGPAASSAQLGLFGTTASTTRNPSK